MNTPIRWQIIITDKGENCEEDDIIDSKCDVFDDTILKWM